MDVPENSMLPEALPTGRMQGRQVFSQLVLKAIRAAVDRAWTPLILSDADFHDWPLGERDVVQALSDWAASGRQIRFLARDYRAVRERHPRLVQWRTQWSHLVEAHAWPSAGAGEVPSVLWAPGWCVERVDPERGVLVASDDPVRLLSLKERIDQAWQRGRPGFAATVLGL
ncbi:MAG: hypothetical protein R3E99_15520 [Burkholderiaceae bacterium]